MQAQCVFAVMRSDANNSRAALKLAEKTPVDLTTFALLVKLARTIAIRGDVRRMRANKV